jgi:hypothetical protein
MDMSSLAELFNKRNYAWSIAPAGMVALAIVAIVLPSLKRSRVVGEQSLALHPASARSQLADKMEPPLLKTRIAAGSPRAMGSAFDHKMVRTGSVDLMVQKPAEAAETIRGLAEALGGFLVSSDVSGGPNPAGGSLTIRVPAARFEEAWTEIRRLGMRVESEKIDAQDVTGQFADEEANLRNLRAEEAQYLAILKQARNVKDMLAVSEKLAEVRGQIEQQQAEFAVLSKQVETVAVAISLHSEAEAQVFGLNWRPLYQMRLALRAGLEAMAGYAAVMISIIFYLPAVLLWMGTILAMTAGGWKLVRSAGRVFFASPKQMPAQNG